MDTEIELKFLVSEAVIPSIPALITQFAKTVKNKPARNLQNAYFDTPSRELRALDIGLRTRCCDGICEQTIKLAGENVGGLHQRPEYNLPIDGNRPELHDFDASIWPHGVQVDALADNLYPLFSTNFIRRTWLVETQAGTEIEVVLDKGEVSANANVEPICELEIELVKGERSELFSLAEKLIDNLPLRMGYYSKAARGYRLADDQPLKASKEIGLVPLSNDDSQERALEKCLSYGIAFVQKHEQCYFQKPTLKTLKRVTDGVSLIRHSLWLFSDIVEKQATERLRGELKWLLSELSWVETAIQLKTFTSKKHAYYKKINAAPELTQVIGDLKSIQPSIDDVQTIFTSTRYNLLLLDLTIWLTERGWRQSWGQAQLQAGEQPIHDLAARLLDYDWQEMKELVEPQQPLASEQYLQLKQRLERNLLSGCCLGALFDESLRMSFRAPWLDIVHGTFELFTLDYLGQLCQGNESEQFIKIQAWLTQKTDSLLSAMEQSREATRDVQPYWRD
ncbi:CYTH domain-containing protein [Pseudoalteromonas sp. Cnat2-41]|uniref:CYTH and CHAD domain-containing protein n=1 Tax=unclassified Pseudoalteromonas TaxID=194690 RepID=UPI001EF98115|nr:MULTISPECIES: CYTH and CHAD domain-containing protein [unclassified Pseudoalteromonas]MCF2862785.1 CYTH domain-containing protein [Pseudoalteromonas sp. CNAT2-18]MCG7558763.1 CYTH domain-containing protein [Pseudoalteromonas sp. CNAT2-18.1]